MSRKLRFGSIREDQANLVSLPIRTNRFLENSSTLLVGLLSIWIQGCEFISSRYFGEADTIAELIDADVTQNKMVDVKGRDRVGDGGGGRFLYDTGSSHRTNLGTVFAPRSHSGRWIRQYDGPINIRWFGAKGDGTTDDSLAIQDTLDLAVTKQQTVYIPAVTRQNSYHCAKTLLVRFTAPGSYLRIHGDGPQSYLFFKGADVDGILIDSTFAAGSRQKTSISFEDFAIGGDASTRDGLVFESTHRSVIKNFWVCGFGRYGANYRGSFLNAWIGGGVSLNIGSPGNAKQAIPRAGIVLGLGTDDTGSNANGFYNIAIEGIYQGILSIIDVTNTKPIQITAQEHGYVTGDIVAIQGVVGNTAANGAWKITVLNAHSFTLDGSTGNDAYVAGGVAIRGVGLYIGGTSYGNTCVSGTIENNAVGVYLDTDSATTVFANSDVSSNATDLRDYGSLTSYQNSVPGGNTHIGGRLAVSSSDLSTFFPRLNGTQIAFTRSQGAAVFGVTDSTAHSADLRYKVQGPAGNHRFVVNATSNLMGGAEAMTISQINGRPTLFAQNDFAVGGRVSFGAPIRQRLSASDRIVPGATRIKIEGFGGAVTLNSVPTIDPGEDGQLIFLQGSNDSNVVTLLDERLLSGSKLRLGTPHRSLSANVFLVLMYDRTSGFWIETTHINN